MDNTTEQSPPHLRRPKSPRQAKQQSHALITGFTLFMMIGLMVLTAYALRLIHQVSDAQGTLGEKFIEFSQTLKAKDVALEDQQKKLSKEWFSFKKNMEKTISQTHYLNDDWLLHKARYVLEMAAINSHWSRDNDSSLTLLQTADDLLQQMSSHEVLEIRQAIASDIMNLKARPTFDMVGVLGQLDALQTAVDTLKLQAIDKVPKPAVDNEAQGMPANLKQSLNLLKQLVVIRRHDEAIKPLVSPLFESALKESVRLRLQAVEWAILNQNPAIVQSNLQQAVKTLQQYFKPDETLVLIQQIKQLAQTQFTDEQPIRFKALPLVNQLIAQQKTQKEATLKQGE
jgi:uroporphyrin-3 C-methyltransferase